jgi:hypothetical protein
MPKTSLNPNQVIAQLADDARNLKFLQWYRLTGKPGFECRVGDYGIAIYPIKGGCPRLRIEDANGNSATYHVLPKARGDAELLLEHADHQVVNRALDRPAVLLSGASRALDQTQYGVGLGG